MKPDKYQEPALSTWHGEQDPHSHPLLKLLGEFGEFCDFYAKCLYKPNYSAGKEKALEELGDIWYYIRILAYQKNLNVESFVQYYHDHRSNCYYSFESLVNNFLYHYQRYFSEYMKEEEFRTTSFNFEYALNRMTYWFCHILEKYEIDIDQLTAHNAERLKDHHGWKRN